MTVRITMAADAQQRTAGSVVGILVLLIEEWSGFFGSWGLKLYDH
jgi:hypothetical protein